MQRNSHALSLGYSASPAGRCVDVELQGGVDPAGGGFGAAGHRKTRPEEARGSALTGLAGRARPPRPGGGGKGRSAAPRRPTVRWHANNGQAWTKPVAVRTPRDGCK